ncbi:hypothetical protein [Clostridium sp. C105KSO13]|uniref:hypothetical protein n=1 Tax=Clostridium sp. C105KSO13 TaxID=1776045 RepID=UPI000740636C|nr:hypothetical protein [Clostridium sp. C105KSO13]CUX13681.1 hypothetical protein BN3456_00024 [Clostridium sp. C105KSO13]
MQLYQFEKIYSQMEKEFGKIRKGEEEVYSMLLLPLEGNVLKIHREFPLSNSRRLREAIALVLFYVKGKYNGEMIDTEKFRNEDNEKLEKALLMAFDPYTNEKIMELIVQQKETDKKTQDMLKGYYKLPVMCLLRIKDSIDTWEKQSGSDGYFDFIESYMGSQIKGSEMNYTIMSPGLWEM